MNQEKKIKVLEAIRQGKVGGGETHILNLVEHLDKSRFEPVVLSFTDGQMIDTLQENGVRNYVIPSERAFDIFKWKKVKKLLQDEGIDIVHVHGTRANSNVYWAAKKLGLPIIYTIHGWSFHDDQSWYVKKIRILVEQYITQHVNCNISVSASNKKTGTEFLADFKSTVINNGIDLKIFDPGRSFKDLKRFFGIADGSCVVGFIARMTLQKDPFTMIKAFKKVVLKNPRAVLLMVGDGELKAEAVRLCGELGISDKVIFEKFRSDIPDVLNAMDIFCLPSLWEGLPIGLLEAMAMQKAVVATAVDGSKEILQDQVNGLAVAVQQEDALAGAVLKLVNDPVLRNRLGKAARETVLENFDIQKMTRAVETVYLNTLNLN